LKKGTYIAIIIACLFLLFKLTKRRRSDYDEFFSDSEIIRHFDEEDFNEGNPQPLTDLAIANPAQNGNDDCDKGGYAEFTFPNPTANPITIDFVKPQDYYAQLSAYFADAPFTTTAVATNPSGIVIANGLWYMKDLGSSIVVYNPISNLIITTIAIAPNIGTLGTGLFIFGQKLYYVGTQRYVSVIDINPNSATYNQLLTNIDCGVGILLFTYAIVGTNLYIAYSQGLKKIDTITDTLTSTFNIGTTTATNVYPSYNAGGVVTGDYLYWTISSPATTSSVVWDTITDTPTGGGNIFPDNSSATSSAKSSIAIGNYLYIGRDNFVSIINLTTTAIVSSIATGTIIDMTKSTDNTTIYASSAANVQVIDVATQLLVATINVGATVLSLFYNNNILYASDNAGVVHLINALNEISSTVSTGVSSLRNPVLYIGGQYPSVIYPTAIDSSVVSLVSTTPDYLSPLAQTNINTISNLVNTAGKVCGIFYRCLTVPQLSNIFQISYADSMGNNDVFKMVPAVYKGINAVLNQVFINEFFKDVFIDNNINIYHVINPGEEVYIKIYVKDYISSVDILKTGKIQPSLTSNTSVMKDSMDSMNNSGYDTEDEIPQEEEWLTVQEVEDGEWDSIEFDEGDLGEHVP
jgi:hypothetical protein